MTKMAFFKIKNKIKQNQKTRFILQVEHTSFLDSRDVVDFFLDQFWNIQ